MRNPLVRTTVSVLVTLALAGCTAHPRGEPDERRAAGQAGKPYVRPFDQRSIPSLPENPTAEDLVNYALQNSPDLEQHYWQWRAAIEQITRDGTQPTNVAFTGATALSRGSSSLSRTNLTLSNDPMADIVWPSKLSAAASRALEDARAAGIRFQKAKYELRAKVLNACIDLALTQQILELERHNAQLLSATAASIEARLGAGAASQQDLLKARNEADLSANQITELKSQLPQQRGALNVFLGRRPDELLPKLADLPAPGALQVSDAEVFALAARRNPELAAMTHETLAREHDVTLAKLAYVPDFSLSLSGDPRGIAQSLSAMVTVPIFRREAIEAAIAQAQANLRAAEAARRAAGNDIALQLLMDLAMLHAADRQLELLDHTILRRAQQAAQITRAQYETAALPLTELLSSQRTQIDLNRFAANLRATRAKKFFDIQAITAAAMFP